MASNRTNLYTDARGSIVLRTSASGANAQVGSYDAYGVPGTANSGRFQYTGQIWLPELGMNYYKARMYSPALGRFMQTDPIGYEDNVNLYGYVANDPVNGVDPSGKCEANVDGEMVGVCPTAETADFVNERMADPDSQVSATNADAVANNTIIIVRAGKTLVSDPNAEVGAGATEYGSTGPIIVTLDQDDIAVIDGIDSETGDSVRGYELSNEEVAEHEIAGHARTALTDRSGDTSRAAVSAENSLRAARGNPFRRQRHDSRRFEVKPR